MTTTRKCKCGQEMVPGWRDWSGTTQVVAACPVIANRHGLLANGELGEPWWIDLTGHQVWVQSKPSHPRSCCYCDEAEGGWKAT